MPLVPGICTQCGATLSADNSKDCMICPYCGTPFIVEKAINHFQNTYNISNSVVNFYGDTSRDFVIRAGVLERYNGSDTVVTVPDNVTVIGKNAFKECFGLKEVTIPLGVVSIEASAFSSCKALKKIELPDSVKKIGVGAFGDCESLSKVVLSKNLVSIEYAAFKECKQLRNVSLPDSVTFLGEECFRGCSNLEKIRMPNNIYRNDELPGMIFMDCDKLREFIVPNDSWRVILNTSQSYKQVQLQLQLRRRQQGVCQYCGGELRGWLTKVCTQCGKEKNY